MPRDWKPALTITLTVNDRQTLLAWQRSATIPAGCARRGRLMLLLADGTSISEVTRLVGMTRCFVYKWVRRFLQHQIEGLADKPGREASVAAPA